MNIALVAHDGRKQEMLEWCEYNHEILSSHFLFATGTTGKLIQEIKIDISNNKQDKDGHVILQSEYPFKGKVHCLLSGPLGGDQQIGSLISTGYIDCLIFFCDNLITQGHQQDVSALSRLAALYNIAFATNRTTADMILTSSLFDNPDYQRIIPKCISDYSNRTL